MTLNCFSNWNGRITISVIDQIHQTSHPFCKDTGYFKCSKQTHTCTHMWVRKIEEDSTATFVKKPNCLLGSWKRARRLLWRQGCWYYFSFWFCGHLPNYLHGPPACLLLRPVSSLDGRPWGTAGSDGWFPWRQRVEAPLSGWECWLAWLQPPAVSAPSAFHGWVVFSATPETC